MYVAGDAQRKRRNGRIMRSLRGLACDHVG